MVLDICYASRTHFTDTVILITLVISGPGTVRRPSTRHTLARVEILAALTCPAELWAKELLTVIETAIISKWNIHVNQVGITVKVKHKLLQLNKLKLAWSV